MFGPGACSRLNHEPHHTQSTYPRSWRCSSIAPHRRQTPPMLMPRLIPMDSDPSHFSFQPHVSSYSSQSFRQHDCSKGWGNMASRTPFSYVDAMLTSVMIAICLPIKVFRATQRHQPRTATSYSIHPPVPATTLPSCLGPVPIFRPPRQTRNK